MKFALIDPSGKVAQFVPALKDCFVVHPSLLWISCPDATVEGATYDGTNFIPPVLIPPPVSRIVAEIQAASAADKVAIKTALGL